MKAMFDAGHDLYTPGKGVVGMKEFEFNRAVAQCAMALMAEYEGVQSFLSHDLFDGVDTSLKQRTDKANALKVDLFVSIHADAFSNSAAKGETVFIYTNTGNSTVAIATAINNELKAELSISNRGVKRADFHVLRETNMDAVLIEFGFMTNPGDLALLKSESYRRKCAEMVVRALVKHYKLKKKPMTQPKGDEKMDQKAIVINNFNDYPAAEPLANKLNCGIFTRYVAQQKQVAQEIFVVGGTKDGLKGDNFILLSGADRYDVAQSVKNYMKSH